MWEHLTKRYLEKRNKRLFQMALGEEITKPEEEEDQDEEMRPTADFDIDDKNYFKYWKGGF